MELRALQASRPASRFGPANALNPPEGCRSPWLKARVRGLAGTLRVAEQRLDPHLPARAQHSAPHDCRAGWCGRPARAAEASNTRDRRSEASTDEREFLSSYSKLTTSAWRDRKPILRSLKSSPNVRISASPRKWLWVFAWSAGRLVVFYFFVLDFMLKWQVGLASCLNVQSGLNIPKHATHRVSLLGPN